MNALERAIDDLVQRAGSLRKAAAILRTDHAYIWKVRLGKKRPSRKLLAKFGLIPVVIYRKNKP
jgi:hypothetical protein